MPQQQEHQDQDNRNKIFKFFETHIWIIKPLSKTTTKESYKGQRNESKKYKGKQ